MPTCKNCQTTWGWWGTLKKNLSFRIGMACPFCNEKQYYSARYKIGGTIIPAIISPLIMFTGIFIGFNIIFLLILMGIFAAFLAVNPFFVGLSSEEEPLF